MTKYALKVLLPRLALINLVCILVMAYLVWFVLGGASDETANNLAGNLPQQVCFLAILASATTAACFAGGVRALADVPLGLVCLLLWCWISIAWAIDPAISFRRVVFSTVLVLSVVYTVPLLSNHVLFRTLSIFFAVMLLMDYLAVGFLPTGIQHATAQDLPFVEPGDVWRGIHDDKNEAGASCAIGFILFLNESIRLRSYITGPACMVAAALFLHASQSKTSGGFVLVAVAVGILIDGGFRRPRTRNMVLGLLLVASVLLYGLADNGLKKILDVFDDPAAFTGRVQIWLALFNYVEDHPLFGAGYGSFWGIGNNSPIYDYASGWITSYVYHAHNGYLDLLIQIGAFGLALTAAVLIIQPLAILLKRPLSRDVPRWAIGAILTFVYLHDLLETSILNRSNSTWVIMLIVYNILQRSSAGFNCHKRAGLGTYGLRYD